jgi:hypothetical protein
MLEFAWLPSYATRQALRSSLNAVVQNECNGLIASTIRYNSRDVLNPPSQTSLGITHTGVKERTTAVSQDGTFSVIQGEIDGRPLVAVIDMGLRELPARQGLSFFLALSASLINPTSEGPPTRNDIDNLNAWEGVVEARLQAVTKLVFVGRVTWNGRRELLYYVGNAQPTVEALKAISGTRPFAFTCERDESWAKVDCWLNRYRRL